MIEREIEPTKAEQDIMRLAEKATRYDDLLIAVRQAAAERGVAFAISAGRVYFKWTKGDLAGYPAGRADTLLDGMRLLLDLIIEANTGKSGEIPQAHQVHPTALASIDTASDETGG